MKSIRFNKEKDRILKKIRKISFKDIIKAIESGKVVKVIKHPNRVKFPNQKIYLIYIKD